MNRINRINRINKTSKKIILPQSHRGIEKNVLISIFSVPLWLCG
jgi:hypothetical protein